jgi:hypothetical protein
MGPKKDAEKAASKTAAAKKTAPAAAAKTNNALSKTKKTEKNITTTKKTAAPAQKENLGPVLTNAAVRRMLEIEFERQVNHDETRFSEDFVEEVKKFLTTDLLRQTKYATAVSRYHRLQSTDAEAFDLLTLIKFNCIDAIDTFIYAEKTPKVGDVIQKQPLLITSA